MWRLAWRNLWRNSVRTGILGVAITFSVGLMLAALGMTEDLYSRMLESAEESAGGAVIVQHQGYWASKTSDLYMADGESLAETLAAVAGVERVYRRVFVEGLADSARGRTPVQVRGVDVESGPTMLGIEHNIERGEFLPGQTQTGGRQRAPIVLGAEIAETLELEVGDKVVVTLSDADGELTRALFELHGTFRTGTQMDEGMAWARMSELQEVAGLNAGVHQLGVTTAPDVDAVTMKERLQGVLKDRDESFEVMTWREAVPEMVGFVQMDSAFLYIYLGVIFLIVAFIIANTFMMSVMERIREFGLLSALGLDDRRIARMLFAEAVWLIAVFVTSGVLVGLALHGALAYWGLDMAAWGMTEMEISGVGLSEMVIRSVIRPRDWALAVGFVVLVTLLSALYPAWRASKLAPQRAMNFYE
jgi:ABC-type lipoprotein release transport system permease subunit